MDFIKTLEKFTVDRQPLEDEYLNEQEGVIYCSKCNTPKQCRQQINNKSYKLIMLCECHQAQLESEKKQQEKQMLIERISKLKKNGLQDPSLYDCCFSKDNGINPEIRYAHTYVDNWSNMKKDNVGLLFWGDVGTGKTFIAGCIANELLERGVSVLMTNFARILNSMAGLYSNDRNKFVDSLNKYSLLIIDDLGIERNSEFTLEQIYHVIDSRYRSKKPLIITSNLTLSELKNPQSLAHSRIYDRILENCIPIKINNQNIRKINANKNLEKAKELFR